MIEIDVSEVRQLSNDLGKIAGSKFDDVDNALHDTAFELTEGAKAQASGTRWRKIGASWTFDRATSVGEVAYEAGPDRAKSGSAALIGAYLGWPNGGGGTLNLDGLVERQEAPMLKKLDAALGRLL